MSSSRRSSWRSSGPRPGTGDGRGTSVGRLIDVRYEERYWYPGDGGEVWIAVYQLVDGDRFLGRDAPELAARGLRVAGVAGAAQHHRAGLDSDAVAPGKPLELRRDPANAHD